jgi:uncharacterized protein YecE (DUF72 family)
MGAGFVIRWEEFERESLCMIRVGIGGWTFEAWRGGVFYPKGLAKTGELAYASRQLNSIEINATYHRNQSPASFRKWALETPDDFVFSVKASRFVTNRRVLAEAGSSIEQFLASGILELGKKLGPILWQFAPAKKFDPEDFPAFLDLLPSHYRNTPLKHAIEVRHQSFATEEFVNLARAHNVAIVVAHSPDHPLIADITGSFMYARLQSSRPDIPTGYPPAEIAAWAQRTRLWEAGKIPIDLPLIGAGPSMQERDVFVYVISGAKERAPAAATALLASLKQ